VSGQPRFQRPQQANFPAQTGGMRGACATARKPYLFNIFNALVSQNLDLNGHEALVNDPATGAPPAPCKQGLT
jgi:hypothetical protein